LSDPIHSIIREALARGRKSLLEHEALELARAAGIPTPRYVFTPLGSKPEPDFPPPYVLKIVSPDIIHKSDVGGVRLNVGAEELGREVEELVRTVERRAPDAELEVYRDVSFRLAPVSVDEAREMIREVKAYKILSGYRGRPPSDVEAIADVIVKVSILGDRYPEIMEMDINPLIAYPKGVLAVDVRVILGE